MPDSHYRSAAGERAVMAAYDEALQRWPTPHESRHLPTRHGETFVVSCGDSAAPPLLLLHGAGTNSSMWAGDVAAFAAHFRVHAADLPGEAGKSSPNCPSWDGPAFAEWVEDVLDELGAERASIAGVSQGGWTALKFAVTHPGRVERLVLVSPGGIVRDRYSFAVQAVALSLLGGWGRSRVLRMLFGNQPAASDAATSSTLALRHFKPRLGVLPLFSDDELRRLEMPVLLIAGSRDPLRDTAIISSRLDALLPRFEAEVVEGAGHVVVTAGRLALPFLVASE